MSIPTLNHVVEAVRDAVKSYPGGVEAMAAKMDMRASSLGNTLNPYADRSSVKLGVEQMAFIVRESGNIRPLIALASELGYLLIPKHVTPDKADIRDEILDDQEKLAAYEATVRNSLPQQARDANLTLLIHDLLETQSLADGSSGEQAPGRVLVLFTGDKLGNR